MLTGLMKDLTVTLSEGTLKTSSATYASLAAGAEVDLDSDPISGSVGKLKRVIVSSGVPIKVKVSAVISGTPFYKATFFVFPGRAGEFIPEKAVTAGQNDKFRVTIKNMEDLTASDVYVTFIWEEV